MISLSDKSRRETERQLCIDATQAEFLSLLFHAPYYRTVTRLPAEMADDDVFRHFVSDGIPQGASPGIFFDAAFWSTHRKHLRGLPPISDGDAPVIDWLRHGLARRVVPTRLFNPFFYTVTTPACWIGSSWCFQHFLEHGDAAGAAPMPQLAALVRRRGAGSSIQDFLCKVPPSQRGFHWGRQDIALLESFFIPEFYSDVAALREGTTRDQAFAQFLSTGIDSDIRPSILFNASHYKTALDQHETHALADDKSERPFSRMLRLIRNQLLRKRGGKFEASTPPLPALTPLAPHVSPFLHWFMIGRHHDIVPTPLFDEARYRQSSPDLADWPTSLFEHYFKYGVFEDRVAHEIFEPSWYRYTRKAMISASPLVDYVLHGERHGMPPGHTASVRKFGPTGDVLYSSAVERGAEQLAIDRNIPAGKTIQDCVARAAAIEPLIALHPERRNIQRAPYKHAAARLADIGARLRRLLPRANYRTIVAIPHCRMAGSARVAGHVVRALREIYPDEPLLLVLTDRSDFDRPEWFGADIDIVDMAQLFPEGDDDARAVVFLDLVRGVKAQRVFNVNSRAAWEMICRYGQQMMPLIDFHSYLFTWELDTEGRKYGYPIEWFDRGFSFHRSILIDNAPLKAELVERHAMTTQVSRKLHVLWSPADDVGTLTHENILARRRQRGEPLRCFWAGRFDRQKRFDVVIDIAKKMPELNIHAWGAVVLGDDRRDMAALPNNIKLMGEYRSFDEIPFNDFDFFLYTSQWDGLPSVLVEAGSRGLPVVASLVGGVSDLISAETGWPVADALNADAYLTAIRVMQNTPEEVTRRARELRRVTHEKCNRDRYLSGLRRALEAEKSD